MESDNPSIGRLRIARASGSVGVGRYRIFASLGRGGMAEIQLASAQGPKGFNKLVVVKRLRPLLAEDPAAVNGFLDEARLNARLNHPNLIHTYEFGEEHGTYFIAMEFLEGQPLHEIISSLQGSSSRKAATPSVWAKVIADALAGLHYAHELHDYDGAPLNIVHRDVSPQNIIVTYDGGVKLVDFGIAKASVNAAKTESQVIKGKLAYMAPEQAEATPLDRRADIFSMGIVLWECLTQQRLFVGDARAVLSSIVNLQFQPPSLFNPAVPLELDAIVRRALEHDPADRFQTAQAMREALERFLRVQPDVVDESAIGALVTKLFSAEREQIQRQVRIQMAELGSIRDLMVADAAPSERGARLAGASAAALLPDLGPSTPQTESVGSLRAVRTSVNTEARIVRGRRRLAAGVAALVVFLAVVVTLRRSAERVAAEPIRYIGAAVDSAPTPPVAPPLSPVPALVAEPQLASASAASAAGHDAGVTLTAPPKGAPAPRTGPPPESHGGAPRLDTDPWR